MAFLFPVCQKQVRAKGVIVGTADFFSTAAPIKFVPMAFPTGSACWDLEGIYASTIRACLISQRVRIGEIDFLPCKAKSRRNPYRAMTPSRGHARLFCTGARCACCRILTDCKDF